MRKIALIAVILLAASCHSATMAPSSGAYGAPAPGAGGASSNGPALATQIAASAAAGAPILPNPSMTPGDTLDVTSADICQSGYAHKVRNVPQSEKDQAYREYGITSHKAGSYEVDHLISLELGGSNSIKNLWPETYHGPWNAHIKDALENKLHDLVCGGQLSLAAAQHAISTNWIAAYQQYVSQTPTVAGQEFGDQVPGNTPDTDSGATSTSIPAPTAAAPTAAAPAGGQLQLVSLTSPVARGSTATLTVRTTPGARCSISVKVCHRHQPCRGPEPGGRGRGWHVFLVLESQRGNQCGDVECDCDRRRRQPDLSFRGAVAGRSMSAENASSKVSPCVWLSALPINTVANSGGQDGKEG